MNRQGERLEQALEILENLVCAAHAVYLTHDCNGPNRWDHHIAFDDECEDCAQLAEQLNRARRILE